VIVLPEYPRPGQGQGAEAQGALANREHLETTGMCISSKTISRMKGTMSANSTTMVTDIPTSKSFWVAEPIRAILANTLLLLSVVERIHAAGPAETVCDGG
jgi:hypothetical protein